MKKSTNKWRNLALALIIFLALILRCYRIETLTSFQADQGRDMSVIYQMLAHQDIKLIGPPSTFGPYQGPLYYYLLAPAMAATNFKPIGPLVFAAFWNVLGLVILYAFCCRFFSRRTAFLSTLIYAWSPLLVETGHSLLNAYFGLPLFIVGLYILALIVIEKRQNFVPLLGFLAGNLVQIHYNFAPFTIFCLLIPFLKNQISKLRYFITFLSFFLLATVPQILFEITHGFLNTHLLFARLQHGGGSSFPLKELPAFFFSTVGLLFGNENVLYGIAAFCFIVVGMFFIYRKPRYFNKPEVDWLASYTVFFLTFAVLSGVPLVYPAYHYYMTVYPILIILLAAVLARKSKLLQIMFFVIFIIFSLINLDLARKNGFTMVNGWSLKLQEKISQDIADDNKGFGSWNIASTVDGDTRALPIRYLLSTLGLENFMSVEQYPLSEHLYLVTHGSKSSISDSATWEITSLKPYIVARAWSYGDNINLYRLDRVKK